MRDPGPLGVNVVIGAAKSLIHAVLVLSVLCVVLIGIVLWLVFHG